MKFLNTQYSLILVNGMEHMSNASLLLAMLANFQTTSIEHEHKMIE